MAVAMEEKKEIEEIIEEKFAKSTGSDIVKYVQDLEKKTDDLLKEMYSPDAVEEEDDKAKKEPAKEEVAEEEEEEKETEELASNADDTVEVLRERLLKAEKRVKDNQSSYTKSKQELSTQEIKSNAVIETLKETIAGLQSQITQRPASETKQEEKANADDIKESVSDLKSQFEELNNIDPDMAKPIKRIIESLESKIQGLTTSLSKKAENDMQTAEEKHFSDIGAAHSDWEDIVKSDEFETYLKGLSPRQEDNARRDLDTGSANNVIGLFDEYKETVGIVKEDPVKKDSRLERVKEITNPDIKKSKEIKTTAKVKYTRSMIKEMNAKDPTWYSKHEADIDVELAAGRVPNI